MNAEIDWDSTAIQVLRQAGRAAGRHVTTVEHLRQALEHPAEQEWPRTEFDPDAALTEVLDRARAVAREERAPGVGRDHLVIALAERTARDARVDLNRLRFTRWRLRRASVEPLRLRHAGPGDTPIHILLEEGNR